MYWGFNNVGYAGAGGSLTSQPLAGFNSWSGTATMDLSARIALVSRARQLYISSPIAAAVIDRMTSGIVGSGLIYAPPETSDYIGEGYEALAQKIKRRLGVASHLKRLDSQGVLNFSQMQELACRNWLLSGDIFWVRDVDGCSWRSIESDRVQTPYFYAVKKPLNQSVVYNPETKNRVIDGVEIDARGRAVAYWILKDYIEFPLLVESQDIERIPAFDDDGLPLVLHIYKPMRPDQYRGIPILSSVIESLHSVKNYSQAELQAAALQASVFGFIQTENPTYDQTDAIPSIDLDEKIPIGDEGGVDDGGKPEEKDPMQLSTDYKNPDEEIFYNRTFPRDYKNPDEEIFYNRTFPRPKVVSAGQIVHLSENEKIQFLQSTHPHQNFAAFIAANRMDVASAVGIPEKALSCSYDGTYSSSRAAVLESNRLFKNLRSYFIDTFVRPVFESFVYNEVKEFVDDPGYVSASMGLESMWQAPTALCLDPKVELEGWKLAIDMGLVDSDEAAMALYGHKAVSKPVEAIQIEKDVV